MSAETVTLKIEEKAKASAEEIIALAQKEAEKIYSDLIAEAKSREQKILDTAKSTADTLRKGILQAASQKSKLDELEVKRELMDKVRQSAVSKLALADEKTIVDLFCKKLSESELSGEFIVFPSPLHRRLVEKNLSLLEKSADIKIKISDTDALINSGFVLSSEIYDVDFSIDSIVGESFSQNEKIIYDTLFVSDAEIK